MCVFGQILLKNAYFTMPNLYFKNVPDVITSSLTEDSFLHGRVRKKHVLLNSMIVSKRTFYDFFISLSDKTGMDILGFDRKLIMIAGQHIADSLLYIINDSLSLIEFFLRIGNFPEWLLYLKHNGDVDVMSNCRPISVIEHIAKMVD